MTAATYIDLKERVVAAGYSEEIDWIDGIQPVATAMQFWLEYSWVVLNSGMKNTIARQIWEKVRPHVLAGGSAHDVFGHKGKAAGIDLVYKHRERLFKRYQQHSAGWHRIKFLETLPWIGPITKFHLAKNFGMDVVKPDRHLVRIAEGYGMGVNEMCEALRDATGDKVSLVDMVVWRAASLGMV